MNTASVTIGSERPEDAAGIGQVVRRAFGGEAEAHLVADLRACDLLPISLAARVDGLVIGHVAFSPVTLEGADDCLALAPLAVDPHRQRQGVGTALATAGLRCCRSNGVRAVFVLGDPAYYARFGFEPATPRGLWFRSPGDEPAFMVSELVPGALDDATGEVHYAPPFDHV